MRVAAVKWSLPDWLSRMKLVGAKFPSLIERMNLVIDLASRNVARRTGGPFAAAVFEQDSGRLVAPGVNMVIPTACSHAHAEMVALAMAQRKLRTYDLGGVGLPRHELVNSCEPCAMCFGAIPWSGVRRVVCAASSEDARAIGFDEGPRPANWIQELEQRQITVTTGIRRAAARQVLRIYKKTGGTIYNARRNELRRK